MALFNFQERFMPFIQDGTKRHTIRSIRRRPQKVGKLIHLYVGLRQKGAKLIIEPVICKDVKTIMIMPMCTVLLYDGILNEAEANDMQAKWMAGRKKIKGLQDLSGKEKNELAWHDGFRFSSNPESSKDCFVLMFTWFRQTHSLPFIGHIMYW